MGMEEPESADEEDEQDIDDGGSEHFSIEVAVYVSTTQAMLAMGAPPSSVEHIVDAAMINTGSWLLTTIGEALVGTCTQSRKCQACPSGLF